MSPAPRRHLLLAALACGAWFAAPATAHAGSVLFGNDLSTPATVVESHAADTVYWNSTLAAERPGPPGEASGSIRRKIVATSPVTGQLRYVTIRGGVLPGGGTGAFRFVVLRPDAGGAVRVVAIDENLRSLPITEDPMYRVPAKGFDWKLCLRKGDYLGLWKIGHGNVRIFGEVPGSVTSWYENAAGIAAGNVFTGTPSSGRELLMEVLVNTGQDAFSRCPGGYKDHLYRNLDVSTPQVHGGVATVSARCPRETYGGCFGHLTLRARIGGRQTLLGSAAFDAPPGRRLNLRVPLGAAHAALLQRRGKLKGELVMKGHDDPSDARNRRAPAPRPGRQSALNIHRVVLRAG